MIKYILLLVILMIYCKSEFKEGYEGHKSDLLMNLLKS